MKHMRTSLAAAAAALAATAMVASPASAAGTSAKLFKVAVPPTSTSNFVWMNVSAICANATENVLDQLTGFEKRNGVKVVRGGPNISTGSGDQFVIPSASGENGENAISTGSGNDAVCAGGGADVIDMGSGNDQAAGEDGADTIRGGTGNDYLWGEGGVDKLYGETGNDTLAGGAEVDLVSGGTGNDSMDATDTCTPGGGSDVPAAC